MILYKAEKFKFPEYGVIASSVLFTLLEARVAYRSTDVDSSY